MKCFILKIAKFFKCEHSSRHQYLLEILDKMNWRFLGNLSDVSFWFPFKGIAIWEKQHRPQISVSIHAAVINKVGHIPRHSRDNERLV